MSELADRWAIIQSNVRAACLESGREPGSIVVIAVTKTVPIGLIEEAYGLGIRDFGESRYQEAEPKIDALPRDVTWHFIGKMQSNKAKRIAQKFDIVHTFENTGQLRELEKADRKLDALIEVNIAQEDQKAGVFSEGLDETVELLSSSAYVRFRGLMTIGPLTSDPEQSRKVFRETARLGERVGAEWLSMGMSADYDVAIQEGATHVRVGSALFGERK